MTRIIGLGAVLTAAIVAAAPLAARQDVALKDLMPKGMVIGVALNQRQSDGVDTAAVEIVTKHFNQISPENLLKFQPVHPAADRYAFEAQDRYVQFGLHRHMQVVGQFENGQGPTARVEAIVDANYGRPRIVFYRDWSELGRTKLPE